MKRHYIIVSIDNLPDDIDSSIVNIPNRIKCSIELKCNSYTLAMLLTELIKKCVEKYPDSVELHQYMLEKYLIENVKDEEND